MKTADSLVFKNLHSAFLSLVIFSSSLFLGQQVHAESDADAFIDTALNILTNGTYLATLAGEKEKIRLEYEKKRAEFERDLTKKSLNRQIEYYESAQKFNESKLQQLNSLLAAQNQAIQNSNEIVNGLSTVIKQMTAQQSSLEELRAKSETWTDGNSFILETLSGKNTVEDAEALCNDSSVSEKEKHLACLWLPVLKTSIDIAKAATKASVQEQRDALVEVFREIVALRRKLVEKKETTSLEIQECESELETIKSQLDDLRGNS